MATNLLPRKFKVNETLVTDPNATWSLQQVKDHLSNIYPELINSTVQEPQIIDDELIYEFDTNVGTKG